VRKGLCARFETRQLKSRSCKGSDLWKSVHLLYVSSEVGAFIGLVTYLDICGISGGFLVSKYL